MVNIEKSHAGDNKKGLIDGDSGCKKEKMKKINNNIK